MNINRMAIIKRHNNINVLKHYSVYQFLYRDSTEPSCGRISLLLTAAGFLSNPGMLESICWAPKATSLTLNYSAMQCKHLLDENVVLVKSWKTHCWYRVTKIDHRNQGRRNWKREEHFYQLKFSCTIKCQFTFWFIGEIRFTNRPALLFFCSAPPSHMCRACMFSPCLGGFLQAVRFPLPV